MSNFRGSCHNGDLGLFCFVRTYYVDYSLQVSCRSAGNSLRFAAFGPPTVSCVLADARTCIPQVPPTSRGRGLATSPHSGSLQAAQRGHIVYKNIKKEPSSQRLEGSEKRRLLTLPTGRSVPSALAGLTSLFGMGRGGTPPL